MVSQIFIADTPDGSIKLKQILIGHDLTFASTLCEARGKLERPFDLVIAGLHFDDSRMFELLRVVKRSEYNSTTPLILFCSRDTRMVRMMIESLKLISCAVGAWTFLDEQAFANSIHSDAYLRQIFERCLTGESAEAIDYETVSKQFEDLPCSTGTTAKWLERVYNNASPDLDFEQPGTA